MPLSQEEFDVLFAQARQGDRNALCELARAYEPQLRTVARVLLGSALRPYLDSVDLVQSVHKSLLVGLRQDKFDISSPDKLIALALTMVRRKVARQWRHLQRQQRLEGETTSGSNPVGLLTALSSPQLDPARDAQIRDAIEHLYRHLDQTEQRIMELRLQGCSTAEVADQLGLDANVLRVHLSRLRRRLREKGVLTEWL